MCKRPLIIILAAVMCLGASSSDSVESRIEKIEEKVSGALSKAGIQFGGIFRSRFFVSKLDESTRGVDKSKRLAESVEYTSVDFDIKARPNDILQGRLIFRMHQDWRNFFSDISNPIFTRWISVDGNVKNVFSYNIGDYKEKYSPLTLWTPQIDIPFEPKIFHKLRQNAENEEFLGNNNRLLQGINMNFDAGLFPLFKEVHWNVSANRLRLADVNDDATAVEYGIEESDMDKYFAGTNLNLTVVPGLNAGATFFDVFDSRYSFNGDEKRADTSANQTLVLSGRLGAGTGLFADNETFGLSINGEIAKSYDDTSWYVIDSVNAPLNDTLLKSDKISDIAYSIDADARVSIGEAGSAKFSAGYIRNGADFRNEMAQSPCYFGRQRIMNVENDFSDKRLYSTFDPLYSHVFKFAPSANVNNWNKMPYQKIAYTRSVFTYEELMGSGIKNLLDPPLQLVMPYGPATPNRKGLRAEMSASLFEKGIELSGILKSFSQIEGDSIIPGMMSSDTDTVVTGSAARLSEETAYLKAGGGIRFELSSFFETIKRPLNISFGYTYSTAKNSGVNGWNLSDYSVKSGFMNAGIYWKMIKQLALSAGYQKIVTSYDLINSTAVMDVTQHHWAAGLEWYVIEGGSVTASVGQISLDRKSDNAGETEASSDNFRSWRTDLFLTVEF